MNNQLGESIRAIRKWKEFYKTVKKLTGSKEQARKALLYVMRIEREAVEELIAPAPSKEDWRERHRELSNEHRQVVNDLNRRNGWGR